MSFATRKLKFSELEGWKADDHLAAFNAFCLSAPKVSERDYKPRGHLVDFDRFADIARRALALDGVTSQTARGFFEDNFQPLLILPEEDGLKPPESEFSGFVTGFFEPVFKASRSQSSEYPIPLLRRPDELVDVDDNNRPDGMDPSFRYAMISGDNLVEFWDRPAIQSGALAERGLELVWLANKTDAFFVHVQGSAKLELDDGTVMRVTYAAKSGHPYSSLAKILCARLGVEPHTMPSDKLADWMRQHPEEIDELLSNNRSYIFFKEVMDLDPHQGPIAAAKVPLVDGRSLAVDRTLHSFGLPFWVTTSKPLPGQTVRFARLMIAHDTGSAIVGAARGDIFMGTGGSAGLIAGRIRHSASMIMLVPK